MPATASPYTVAPCPGGFLAKLNLTFPDGQVVEVRAAANTAENAAASLRNKLPCHDLVEEGTR